MAHVKDSDGSTTPRIVLELEDVALPAFTFAPFMGRRPLDQIDTDIVLMTRLYRMAVPAAMHVKDPLIGKELKRIFKSTFQGKRGDTELVKVQLSDSQGDPGRYIYLVGLGHARGYCGSTACSTFDLFFQKVFELGVESATIPFIPNPMTRQQMTHKATAFKLKRTLLNAVKARGGAGNLQEIQIYCHPAAVRSIMDGLLIEQGMEDCHCQVS